MRRARDQRQRAGHVILIALAHRREHEPARGSLEELAADKAFQVGDLVADGRCGDVQFIGRLVDAAEAGDDFERNDSL